MSHEQLPYRISRAAASAFSLYGYSQTSMELIAKSAGVSRQGLYRHAANKEFLFRKVVENLHQTAFDAVTSAAEEGEVSGRPLPELLFLMLDARYSVFLDWLTESPHAEELTNQNTHIAADIPSEYAERLLDVFAEVIETNSTPAQLSHIRDSLTARGFASTLIAASRGLKDKNSTRTALASELEVLCTAMAEGLLAGRRRSLRN